MRTIHTARLRLVPVTVENAGTLWEILQAPDLRDYQDLPNVKRPQFLRAVGARPSRFGPGAVGRFEWLVYYVNAREGALGWVSLRITDADRTSGEVGYSVMAPHRGRGIASEAVAALIEEGFVHARLRRIRAYCLPQNLSSRAVLRHNGFEAENTLPHGATVQGKSVDVMAHTLERSWWTAALKRSRQATRS